MRPGALFAVLLRLTSLFLFLCEVFGIPLARRHRPVVARQDTQVPGTYLRKDEPVSIVVKPAKLAGSGGEQFMERMTTVQIAYKVGLKR